MIDMKILFRTNAGNEGLGHLNRCLSLYKAMDYGEKIFIVNNEAELALLNRGISKEKIVISTNYDDEDLKLIGDLHPSLLIIDTYKASPEYLESTTKLDGTIIVLFDDNGLYKDAKVDVIINGNIHADNIIYGGEKKCLLGPKYLVINPDLWNAAEFSGYDENSDLLITCGAADPHNTMENFIHMLKRCKRKKKLIIGPFFDVEEISRIKKKIDDSFELIFSPISLKKHIMESEIVITASGSTVYEILRLDKKPIIFITAEDQSNIAKNLEKKGIYNLGWYNNIEKNDLLNAVNLTSDKNYGEKIKKLFSLFDGMGAFRVAEELNGEFL